MDRQLENKCLNLVENYRILAAGNKMQFSEMILACAGIFLAAGVTPDMSRIEDCKKLLRSKAGIFSNFRGSDELLVRCKMALAADPALYFENLEREYQHIKSFFSGEQTVLAAMILAEHGVSAEDHAEKTKQIYKEMKEAHPWLTSENDLPFAALMAVSGRHASAVYAEAEKIYALLQKNLHADRDTLQMLSHILAIRSGRAEEKCEKLCALAGGLKEAGHSLGRGSRLAILGILADSSLPTDALVDRICEADDFLKQHKPFHGLFGVGKDCRRMFAVQMVHSSISGEDSLGASVMLAASVELAIITMILLMIIVSSTASYHAGKH
ncbi:MAG: DUF4003 family protein [Oscillospiraceae bacterium]|nr:DUF4003 family protein [Oscillospiraceae bacterium]